MSEPSILGLTTIYWGSKGLAEDIDLAIVVESFQEKGKNDVIEIEDGDGFAIAAVLIVDGKDVDVNTLYDSGITYPAVGDWLIIKSPRDQAGVECFVIDINDDANRKKEAMTKITVRHRPNIAP